MNKGLLFVLFFVVTNHFLYGQCSLSNLMLTAGKCDESGRFYVTVNVNRVGSGEKFGVFGNGINYGNYKYADLPIKIGPLRADCITDYEFLVRDSMLSSCSVYKKLGTICCSDDCRIRIAKADVSTCQNGKYNLDLDLKHYAPDHVFDLYNNGKLLGQFQYSALPIRINSLESSGNEVLNTIVVCAYRDLSCCDTIKFANPCICSITNMRGAISTCDTTRKKFDYTIDFDHNLTSDSFRLGGNSVTYGTFAYRNLPLTIRDLSFNDKREFEFLAIDKNDPLCFGSFSPGIVNSCSQTCKMNNVYFEPLFCGQDSLFMAAKFLAVNGSVLGFNTEINKQRFGIRDYGKSEYLFGPLKTNCETGYHILLSDAENNSCKIDTIFTHTACCDKRCAISDIQISEQCDNNQLVAFDLSFKHQGVSDTFTLRINNVVIGKFLYKNLPIKITNLSEITPEVDILVSDNKLKDSCYVQRKYEFECNTKQPCSFSNIKLSAVPCNANGTFYANLKFTVTNAASTRFIAEVVGIRKDTFPYGLDQYPVGPLNGDCQSKYNYLLYDMIDTTCKARWTQTDVVCCPKCEISQGKASLSDCNTTGGYDVMLDFNYKVVKGLFDLWIGDKKIGTYSYLDLPVNLKDIKEKSLLKFKMVDHEFSDCTYAFEVAGKNCVSSTRYDASLEKNLTVTTENNSLRIKFNAHSLSINDELNIFDFSGKSIFREILKEEQVIDMSAWPVGIYMVGISTHSGVYLRKFVKGTGQQ
jgi:hypothetical protein